MVSQSKFLFKILQDTYTSNENLKKNHCNSCNGLSIKNTVQTFYPWIVKCKILLVNHCCPNKTQSREDHGQCQGSKGEGIILYFQWKNFVNKRFSVMVLTTIQLKEWTTVCLYYFSKHDSLIVKQLNFNGIFWMNCLIITLFH